MGAVCIWQGRPHYEEVLRHPHLRLTVHVVIKNQKGIHSLAQLRRICVVLTIGPEARTFKMD